MPKLLRLRLTSDQRGELFDRQRQVPAASRLWRRLEIVRLADWGERAPAIAVRLEVEVHRVRHALKAFQADGFAGLADRPRSGRPPRLRDVDLVALEAHLDQDAAGDRTWTLDQLLAWLASERHVRISASRLGRRLRARHFRYKRTKRSVQHKADPVQQAEKAVDLQTLAAGAAEGRVDLRFLDESGFSPTLPLAYTWVREGTRALLRDEAPQRRRVNVLGAWAPLGDSPACTYLPTTGKITSELVLAFLWSQLGGMTTPLGTIPEGFVRPRPLVVVLDNGSAHTSRLFLAQRDVLAHAAIHLFSLPTYSPHLTLIEALWRQVTYQHIPARTSYTLDALLQAVCAALDHYVRTPVQGDENLCQTA